MVARPILAFTVSLVALLVTAGPVVAQEGTAVVQGGEPGISIVLGGIDLASANAPGSAIEVDPASALDVNITLAAPPDTTWEIRELTIAVLIKGAGSTPPDALVRRTPAEASIPPGFTVYVNRSFSIEALKPVGAGLFIMRAEVIDAGGSAIHSNEFYVKVIGNPILTVAGATATAASVATGYGLWQIVRDLKEGYDARKRHKKREAEKESKTERVASVALTASEGLEGALFIAADLDQEASRMWRRRVLAWTATGLGLGGVLVSWAQFLGYIPVNLGDTLLTAAGGALIFLTLALVTLSLRQRLARAAAARRVPVQEAGAQPAAEAPAEAPRP